MMESETYTVPTADLNVNNSPARTTLWRFWEVLVIVFLSLVVEGVLNIVVLLILLFAGKTGLDTFMRVGIQGLQQLSSWFMQTYLSLSFVVQFITVMGVISLVARLSHKTDRLQARFKVLPARQMFGWVFVGGLTALMTGLGSYLVLWAQGGSWDNPQMYFVLPAGAEGTYKVFGVVMLGLLIPMAEESLYRGVLFDWLWGKLPFWVAAIAGSLIFAVVHGNLVVGTAAFMLGIATAWAYARSGTLWSAILVHATHNTLKLLLIYLMSM